MGRSGQATEWTSQQIVEAFPADGTEPKYLLRDRDSIYGDYFTLALPDILLIQLCRSVVAGVRSVIPR